MNNSQKIEIEYSKRRPLSEAWCVRSDGHTTYASTREEAIKTHRNMLDTYKRIACSLKLCADKSRQTDRKR